MVLGNRFAFDWLILRRLVLETNHTWKYFFKCHFLCSMYNLKRKALLRAQMLKNIHRDWMQAGNDAWPPNAFIKLSIMCKRMLLDSAATSLLFFCNKISWLGSEEPMGSLCIRKENNWKDRVSSTATPEMFIKQWKEPPFFCLQQSLLGKQLSCDRQNKYSLLRGKDTNRFALPSSALGKNGVFYVVAEHMAK